MAGTDKSQTIEYRPSPAIILCEPQLGENVGSTARAMANFGLWDLRLVRPRDGWPNERAIAAASRADHVIERVRVFASLEEAIADLSLVFATTARRRDIQKPVYGPDEASRRVIGHIRAGGGAGLLFGRERWGLLNEEISLAEAIVTLPVEPAFASLNIAQAVLVVAYEWRRQHDHGEVLPFTGGLEAPAERKQLMGLFSHLEETLDRTGFFKSGEQRPTMVNNLRAIFTRAQLSLQEIRTLRGVISSIDRAHERQRPERMAGAAATGEEEPK
jgi:tRNA/rRNA methyltransferase